MTAFERKKTLTSSLGTALVWLFLLLLVCCLPDLVQKPVYKTVKITLEQPQNTQDVQKMMKAQEQTVAPQSQAPSQAAPPPPAPKKTEPAPAAAKSKPAPAKTTPQKTAKTVPAPREEKLQKSMEELMAERLNSKSKQTKTFDWDSMNDVEENKSDSKPNEVKTKKLDNNLSGSSASSTKAGEESVSSKTYDPKSKATAASDSTGKSLNKVAAARRFSPSDNGVSSIVNAAATTNAGGTDMQMSDGSSRTLVEPKKPVIFLTESEAAKIDTTKEVRVVFNVTPDGRVPVNKIKITPSAVLPTDVQNTVIRQISEWRFSPASGESTASFEYTIKKN